MERMLRVNELLKRELGQVLERLRSDDSPCLTTVTRVKASPDLRRARVSVSVYGGGPQAGERTLAFLRRHRKEIQQQIGSHVKMKYTPVLEFCLDDRLDQADRVMKILDELEKGMENGG